MNSSLRRTPALALLFGAWSLPLCLLVFAHSPLDEAVGWKTWSIIIGCIAGAAIGVLLGCRLRKGRRAGEVSSRLAIGAGVLGAAMGFLYWKLAGTPGVSLEETRRLLMEKSFSQSSLASYASQLGGGLSLVAVAMATQARRPIGLTTAILGISLGAWIGLVLNTGGRVFPLCLIATAICGIGDRYSHRIFRLRWLSLGGVLLVLLFGLNIWFVETRMESWFQNPESESGRVEKAELLVGKDATLVLESPYATTAIWLLLQFTVDPVYYLDYYIKHVELPPQYGLYEWSVIANRVPGYDWQAKRDEIDSMYSPIGVTTNVWGTGIRDVMVDFGPGGAIGLFLMMGLASGLLRYSRAIGGRVLYVLALVWIAYSPFNSPLTLRPFQIAVFIGAAWGGIGWIRAGRWRRSRVGSEMRFEQIGGSASRA